jgi:hypothetical protein
MSSSTNTEAPLPNATIVANISSDEPVSYRDCSVVLRGAPEPVNASFMARDISLDTVTSPLEALALACVAERETEDQQPSAESEANTFTVSDVLCGRGGLTNNAPGNVFFRRLVRIKQESYLLATKREKAGVAREIVDMVRALDPPGKFLKKDSNGVWVEIGDRKAREKTSQALREGAPELRQGLQTADEQLRVVTAHPPHLIAPLATVYPAFLHPRKFFKPDPRFDNGNHIMSSNRARIVSDDSVVGIRPLLQNQNDTAAGSKRKVDDPFSCSLQEKMDVEHDTAKRGPRLKLLKSRLMV